MIIFNEAGREENISGLMTMVHSTFASELPPPRLRRLGIDYSLGLPTDNAKKETARANTEDLQPDCHYIFALDS